MTSTSPNSDGVYVNGQSAGPMFRGGNFAPLQRVANDITGLVRMGPNRLYLFSEDVTSVTSGTKYDIELAVCVDDPCGLVDTDGDGCPACRDPRTPAPPSVALDCDDGNALLGCGTEACNGIDDDCDGTTDNPTRRDVDGDGFDDGCDNCPKVFNPLQADSNGNGIGDACDSRGPYVERGAPGRRGN
jgi:hypothetical protein